MKPHAILFICLLIIAVRPVSAHQESEDLPFVVLIGDSIRLGYQETVAKALAGKATIWSPDENCKSSGYVRDNLSKWLGDQRPAIVHINAGLHDVVRRDHDLTSTDIADYKENVIAIIAALQGYGNVKIIWASTTPVNDELHAAARAAGRRLFKRENQDVIRFNAVVESALSGSDVIINDVYTLVQERDDPSLYSEDGVHFSLEGKAMLGEAVAQAIAAQLSAP